jgi:hypothetical protein
MKQFTTTELLLAGAILGRNGFKQMGVDGHGYTELRDDLEIE